MTHVVTDSCIHCKFTDCVEVCPVDCFREGPYFLVIDPDECIDCAVCIAECPVDAIFAEAELPPQMVQFLDINKKLADSWPVIRKHKDALPGADGWRDAKNKLAGLEIRTVTSSNP